MRGSALLLHGLTSTPQELERLARALGEAGFHTVTPLLSGHGESIAELQRTRHTCWISDVEQAWNELVSLNSKPRVIVGESFGSLLAFHLASKSPTQVDALVALSPPMKMKRRKSRWSTYGLSLLPDAVLDRLGTIPKEVRAPGALVLERSAYPVHSLAGIARLEKIRRDVLQRLSLVQAPTLLIQDPFEHHLAIDGLFSLADALENSDISLRIVPGGQHELLLGREYERVIRMVCEFLTGVVEQVAVK